MARIYWAALLYQIVGCCSFAAAAAIPTVIAVAADASPSERHAAADLAATLNKIGGSTHAAFAVVAATKQRAGKPQIAVGFGAATLLGVPRSSLAGLGLEGYIAATGPAAAAGECALYQW